MMGDRRCEGSYLSIISQSHDKSRQGKIGGTREVEKPMSGRPEPVQHTSAADARPKALRRHRFSPHPPAPHPEATKQLHQGNTHLPSGTFRAVRRRIQDVLQVLTETRRAHEAGASPLVARRAAITVVARARAVRPETIRAACARGLRPDVQTLDAFDKLIDAWFRGDARGLAQVVLPRVPVTERPGVDNLLYLQRS